MTPVPRQRGPVSTARRVRLALAACALLLAPAALAQREFVQEVDADRKRALDAIDLDAPDAAVANQAASGRKAEPAVAPGADQPAVVAAPAELEGAGIRIVETSLAAFLEKWEVRAAAVRQGNSGRASTLLPELDEALLDLGVHGARGGLQAPAAATALLVESRRALVAGSLEGAAALIDAAERASPDLVAVHTSRALLAWTAGDVGGTLNSLATAIGAHARDPLSSSQLLARVLALLLIVLVLLLALLAALLGLPALRLLSFDLLQVLPKGAHGGQVFALIVIAGMAPLVVGAGPVFGSLWILTLAWLHLSVRERAVTVLVAICCIALPLGVDAVARLTSYAGSRADRAQRALLDAHAEPLREALKTRPAADLDKYERAALAMWHKREGHLEEAKRGFEAIAATATPRVASSAEDLAFVHGGLGVIAALQGKDQLALEQLGQALTADPQAYAAAFNASVLHYRAGRTDKAQSIVRPLAKEAPALLNALRKATYRVPDEVVMHNRAFIDVYPRPTSFLRRSLDATSDSQDSAEVIGGSLLRGQRGARAHVLLAAFPLAWLLLLLFKGQLRPAQGCVRCGQPASRRVDRKDVPPGTCSQCFHVFLSTRSRIDAGVKLRKEREIIQWRTRLRQTILLFGLLFPGAGHLWGGAPVRGVVYATVHGLCLGVLLLSSGLVPTPRLPGPWLQTTPMMIAGAMVALVWLIAIRSAWVFSDEIRVRRRR